MNINNNSKSQSDRRAPLYNISARKNQMEYEQSNNGVDYSSKITDNIISSSRQTQQQQSHQIHQQPFKQVGAGQQQAMQIELPQKSTIAYSHELTTLRNALKEAIVENEILRNRVTETEALYAAAEDEIEKRDACIEELVHEVKKLSLELEKAQKQNNFQTHANRKRTHSQ